MRDLSVFLPLCFYKSRWYGSRFHRPKSSIVLLLSMNSNINPLFERNDNKARRLSRWFVSHQKSQWILVYDENTLNIQHIRIIVLLAVTYVCHVVGSPFIRFVEDQIALTIIYTLETLCMVLGTFYFLKICRANASWAATKLLFAKDSIDTYIYLFWMMRCFVLEILKGQVIYSFVISFHTVLIYATDTWYLCNRKVLIASIVLYLLMIVYEFFVTISPVGPTKPSWTFMNIETTANSLSRSNYFNLFIIFFDALIVIINDVNRSKYMMLSREPKRKVLEVPASKERLLKKLWIASAIFMFAAIICYIMESSSAFLSSVYPGLENISVSFFFGGGLVSYYIILYYSSSSESKKWCMLWCVSAV